MMLIFQLIPIRFFRFFLNIQSSFETANRRNIQTIFSPEPLQNAPGALRLPSAFFVRHNELISSPRRFTYSFFSIGFPK